MIHFTRRLKPTINNKHSTTTDETFIDLVNAKSPVHAEIQLLFHYELNPQLNPPRIILSTKKPCFLCALFVKCHGKYHMPPSHGRLYEKWTLPATLDQLSNARKAVVNRTLQAFYHAISAAIETAVIESRTGKVASMESLFPLSSLWARISQSLFRLDSLQRLVEEPQIKSPAQKTTDQPEEQHIKNPAQETLAQLLNNNNVKTTTSAGHRWRSWWHSSTPALAHNKLMAQLSLARGTSIAFQQDLSPLSAPTAVRAGDIRLSFSCDVDDKDENDSASDTSSLLFNQRKISTSTTVPRMLVKILRLATSDIHELQQRDCDSKHIADVSGLMPGQEMAVEQDTKGFHLIYKEECVLVRTREASLTTV